MVPQGAGASPSPWGILACILSQPRNSNFEWSPWKWIFFWFFWNLLKTRSLVFFSPEIYETIRSFNYLFFVETWPPGKSWKHNFSDIPWTLGPSGPSLDSRAQNSVQDSLNESSVRPNGTPVMPLLHFGHGWLFRSKTTNYLLCKFSYEGNNNNNNNQRFWWQEPPGKIIFVLFCFATCRDEEKETQHINVVGTNAKNPRRAGGPGGPGVLDPQSVAEF